MNYKEINESAERAASAYIDGVSRAYEDAYKTAIAYADELIDPTHVLVLAEKIKAKQDAVNKHFK